MGQDSCNLYPEISAVLESGIYAVMLKRGLFKILLYIKAKELKQKTTVGFSGTAFTMLLQPCRNKFLSVCVGDWYCSPALFMLSWAHTECYCKWSCSTKYFRCSGIQFLWISTSIQEALLAFLHLSWMYNEECSTRSCAFLPSSFRGKYFSWNPAFLLCLPGTAGRIFCAYFKWKLENI